MEMAATKASMPPSTAKSARRNPIVGHFCNKICHKLTFRVWQVQRSKPLLAALKPISPLVASVRRERSG